MGWKVSFFFFTKEQNLFFVLKKMEGLPSWLLPQMKEDQTNWAGAA